ncbi:hypothetical protein K523DRAFT_408689 [Schizophyllum commune Tattone D]|nr:hypothetical protein K523DRAFT_408689 [Schizophyllum commune Tattone D]
MNDRPAEAAALVQSIHLSSRFAASYTVTRRSVSVAPATRIVRLDDTVHHPISPPARPPCVETTSSRAVRFARPSTLRSRDSACSRCTSSERGSAGALVLSSPSNVHLMNGPEQDTPASAFITSIVLQPL